MKSMNPLWKANSYDQDINNTGGIKILKKKNNKNLRKSNWIGYFPACNMYCSLQYYQYKLYSVNLQKASITYIEVKI